MLSSSMQSWIKSFCGCGDSGLCECQLDPFSVFMLSIDRLVGFIQSAGLNLSDAKQGLGCCLCSEPFLPSPLMEDQKVVPSIKK